MPRKKKPRRTKKAKRGATQLELAAHLGLNRRTVADLVGGGILSRPLDLDRNRREYLEHLRASAAGRVERDRPGRRGNGAAGSEERADALRQYATPPTLWFPWAAQPAEAARYWVQPVGEWCEENGIDDAEFFRLLSHGFPMLPNPDDPLKEARISAVHAGWWSLATRALIRCAGGDWKAEQLGAELDRLAEPTLRQRRGFAWSAT